MWVTIPGLYLSITSSVACATLLRIGSQSKWQIASLPPGLSILSTSFSASEESNQCQHWPANTASKKAVGSVVSSAFACT